MTAEEREIPCYLFTGFMDSGKTSMIRDTLFNMRFGEGQKKLIIMCEDGDEELDDDKLRTVDAVKVMVENKEDITRDLFHELNEKYKPEMVIIEYNGTWELKPLLEMDAPDDWVIVQNIAMVDATTFENYVNNMRMMILEQFTIADTVMFNRCTDDTPRGKFRRIVKAKNRKTTIEYEKVDGTMYEGEDEELPYDMSLDHLDITDADYGIFYLDVMDNPKNYVGKTVSYLGLVYKPKGKLKPDVFVPGRFAMNCCAEDIQFIGIKCKYDNAEELEHKSWVNVTAEIKYEFAMEYKGKGPVLYAKEVKSAEKPEDELVYFS